MVAPRSKTAKDRLEEESVVVRPARNVLGSLRVPGDKSISHRYAMLAALAAGRSRFENFAPGADCSSTLDCVRSLGCAVERGSCLINRPRFLAMQQPLGGNHKQARSLGCRPFE